MTRWWRRAVLVLTVLGIAALAIGPTRYLLSPDRGASAAVAPFGARSGAAAPPRLGPWPTGIADTAARGGLRERAPTGDYLTIAEALARPPRTAYVAVSGPAVGHALPGVGAVLGPRDVRSLTELADPEHSLRWLTSLRGGALGLLAVTGDPPGKPQLVMARSSALRRVLLSSVDPATRHLIDVTAQQRPDLAVLVTPPDRGAPAALPDVGLATTDTGRGPTDPGTAAYRSAVARAVTTDLLPQLAGRRPAVARELFTGSADDGLFVLGGDRPTPTARGEAFRIAALAVPPGSKVAPATSTGGLTALAFERPQGGASVLVWNPGAAQRITVDLPYGDQVHRVRLRVAAQALTAVLLEK